MPLTGQGTMDGLGERLIHKTHRQFVKPLQALGYITLVTEPMLTRHKSILWSNDKVQTWSMISGVAATLNVQKTLTSDYTHSW